MHGIVTWAKKIYTHFLPRYQDKSYSKNVLILSTELDIFTCVYPV